MDKILTAQELAQWVKISESTINKLAGSGEISGFRLGHSWRFELDEIMQLIKTPKTGKKEMIKEPQNIDYFAPEERKPGKAYSYRSSRLCQEFLSLQEITELRETLGMSQGAFAHLIGCTRQTIYNWEKTNKTSGPSRMANLLMKLVKQSFFFGMVDVLAFLIEEAKKGGLTLEVERNLTSSQIRNPGEADGDLLSMP